MPIYARKTKSGVVYDVEIRTITPGINKTFKDKESAKEFEAKVKLELLNLKNSKTLKRAPQKKYGEAVLRWLDSGAPESMYGHIRATLPYLENVLLNDCVDAASEMKRSMLADKLKTSTINRRLAVVRRVLNLAFSEFNWLDFPLGGKIKLLKEHNERHYYLSHAEVSNLINCCSCTETKKAILIAAYCGLRQSEILQLKKTHYKDGLLRIEGKTKSGKVRSVPVPEFVRSVCEGLPLKLTYSRLRYFFEEARAKADIAHFRFHDLRHTYASFLVENSQIPLQTVKSLMGHSNLAVTTRYAHLRDNHSQVGQLLNKARKKK